MSIFSTLSCFQYVKGTKKKANHNYYWLGTLGWFVVSNTSKVLKRKQITTPTSTTGQWLSCFQYVKGTKKKANHNKPALINCNKSVVSNTSKVLKRKQITTAFDALHEFTSCFQYVKGTKKKANHNAPASWHPVHSRCFQYVKGTKKKANHNLHCPLCWWLFVVSNTSKVLKRKQITTWSANAIINPVLFPIRQRY